MEFVYVVPRDELFPESTPHGLRLFGEGFDSAALSRDLNRHGYFVEREWAESNPRVKQIIPYSVVTRSNEIFLLRRTRAGAEKRLHEKLSIGVGGHINPVDLIAPDQASARRDTRNPLPAATKREIEEELNIQGDYELTPVGLLNDDTDPVGAVHLGWVQTVAVSGPVAVRETEQLEGRWVSRSALRELEAAGANFESWSRYLIRQLDRFPSSSALEGVL
jgi:predicted NUDIX family phosphoesterase